MAKTEKIGFVDLGMLGTAMAAGREGYDWTGIAAKLNREAGLK